jgi:hypothetical protein
MQVPVLLSLCFLLLSLWTPYLYGQETYPLASRQARSKRSGSAELSPVVERLIDTARTCPPEFASDALIRLSETRAGNRVIRRQLIEDAFRLATVVKEPFRLRSLPGSEVDTRAGYRSRAFHSEMDRLSLQCRAVQAMLGVDKLKARELFEEITFPSFQRLDCADSLVPDVDIFYRTLTNVVAQSFSLRERAGEEHLHLVRRHIAAMGSGVQIGPMANVLSGIEATPDQRVELIQELSGGIGRISDDDRTFSYAVHEAARGIGNLLRLCRRENLSGLSLVDTFRTYLVRHFTSVRCSAVGRGSEQALVKSFNTTLRSLAGVGSEAIQPVGEGDQRPKKLSGRPLIYRYWQTAEAKDFLRRIKELRFGRGTIPVGADQRATEEWIREAMTFLNDLESWKGAEEPSRADYFHQKCILYMALTELQTEAAMAQRVTYSFVSFLSQNYFQAESPMEWFLHLSNLLTIARRSEATSMTLRESKDPVCSLYADLVLSGDMRPPA